MISPERIKEIESLMGKYGIEDFVAVGIIKELLAERRLLVAIVKPLVDKYDVNCICGSMAYDGYYGGCSKECLDFKEALKAWKESKVDE